MLMSDPNVGNENLRSVALKCRAWAGRNWSLLDRSAMELIMWHQELHDEAVLH